ncbi:uncharacterized protein A4U43_C07F19790 [Asparagus officinalis]|uniref:Uncharacterized protein n=1 Tax=Asparagus officinalis TaxID=4686 RepID=A0A5P1EGQ2_ASPOF|nr:uncharacterized protein A4U43_C07F19790 [Asparagus officinalis]
MSSLLLLDSNPPRWEMPRAREDQGPTAQAMLGLSSLESQSQAAPCIVSSSCNTKEEPPVARPRESQPQEIEDAKLFSKEEGPKSDLRIDSGSSPILLGCSHVRM